MSLSTCIERLIPTRFIFLTERTDSESGNYINCFRESVNFFIPSDQFLFGDLFFNDFTSLSDDLEKIRARSPEAQFFFPPSIEAEVNFTNALETKNETNGTVSKNLELTLIHLMRLSSIHKYGSIVR